MYCQFVEKIFIILLEFMKNFTIVNYYSSVKFSFLSINLIDEYIVRYLTNVIKYCIIFEKIFLILLHYEKFYHRELLLISEICYIDLHI